MLKLPERAEILSFTASLNFDVTAYTGAAVVNYTLQFPSRDASDVAKSP